MHGTKQSKEMTAILSDPKWATQPDECPIILQIQNTDFLFTRNIQITRLAFPLLVHIKNVLRFNLLSSSSPKNIITLLLTFYYFPLQIENIAILISTLHSPVASFVCFVW